jgi:hypothetical protein
MRGIKMGYGEWRTIAIPANNCDLREKTDTLKLGGNL